MSHPKRHYYVINLPKCQDRKERITKRLKHHGVYDQTTFIEAVDKESGLLDWFQDGLTYSFISTRPEHACFLSHLKAIRTFALDPNVDEAIILEDDAMLHNNFKERLEYVLARRGEAPLLMLFFLAAAWDGVQKAPSDITGTEIPSPPHLFTIQEKIYGAVGYWMTKDYAWQCLSRLDRPLRYFGELFVTSELITRLSGGYFVSPPLIVEEAVYSTLRQGNDLNVHRDYCAAFGYENYSAADEGDIKAIWKPLGYNPLNEQPKEEGASKL